MNKGERWQVGSIEVRKVTEESRKKFFKLLENQVVIYPDWESFQASAIGMGIVEIGDPAYLGFSSFDIYYSSRERATLVNPVIHINKIDYRRDGREYGGHIPFVVHHEKVELWNAVCGCFEDIESDEMAAEEYDELSHNYALVEEFEMAITCGAGVDHLKFIIDTICQWEMDPNKRAVLIKSNRKAFREAQRNLGIRESARLSGGI